jgi:hypothetical protein
VLTVLEDAPVVVDQSTAERPCHLAWCGCQGRATHAGMCLACGDVSLLCTAHAELFGSFTAKPIGLQTLRCEACGKRGFVPSGFSIDPL